jgi:hypothetical protein
MRCNHFQLTPSHIVAVGAVAPASTTLVFTTVAFTVAALTAVLPYAGGWR